MRITVFTSNQPRHVALIESLASVADEVFAIQECNTVRPGQTQDFFRKSPVMRDYFARVMAAEECVFGEHRFLPSNARSLSIKMGDLSLLSGSATAPALKSDAYVVFGSSYIRGPLCDALVERRAVNIHMGVSPQYRGSSTNFWAMYDRRIDRVGATIHRLTAGLDSGPILFHALPLVDADDAPDAFEFGMRAVRAAHRGLAGHLATGGLHDLPTVAQDKSREIRYTRNADFTDEVADEYLHRLPDPAAVRSAAIERDRNLSDFVRPFIG